MKHFGKERIAKLKPLARRLREVNKAELDPDYPNRDELIEDWNRELLQAISYGNSSIYEDIADVIYLLERGYYEDEPEDNKPKDK